MPDETPTFETELESVVDALYALTPMGNRISQFIELAEGQDYDVMREAYPELLGSKNTRDRFFKIFGFEVRDGKIRKAYSGELRNLIESTVSDFNRKFKRDDLRDKVISSLLKEIPNPELEWLVFRLHALKEVDATAIAILKIWRVIAKETQQTGYFNADALLKDLKEYTELEEERLKDALNSMMSYKVIDKSGERYVFSDSLKEYLDVVDDI